MKLILLSDTGRSRSLCFSRWSLAAGGAIAMLVIGAAVVGAARPLTGGTGAMLADWQRHLARAQGQVEELRIESRATVQAVGRQLAKMQARLARMEALGARVTEMAGLDEGEFSFAEPVAQGGPAALPARDALQLTEFNANLNDLARELKVRERDLEVLESMLRNRDFRQASAVAGRPVTWGWMSSGFGRRADPFSGRMAWHQGVDFAGKAGSDVIAAASGVVTHAGERSGYGKMVEINHGDGYVTRYGHHSALAVRVGDIVKKGQTIGTMGSSGRATGPHVHYEVLKDGRHVDPMRYVARR